MGKVVLIVALVFLLGISGIGGESSTINETCAGEGENVYDLPEKGPTYCCEDLILSECVGECTPSILGTCVKCRDENAECTPEDIPCCEGLVEVGFCLPDENGQCICATCGSICRPCGNGVCDSNENRCNCPEDCGETKECKQVGNSCCINNECSTIGCKVGEKLIFKGCDGNCQPIGECIPETKECKQVENSCCINNECVAMVCEVGEKLIFEGCDENCQPIVRCIVESDMDSCLDESTNYWDQETDSCYSGYDESRIKELCADKDGKNFFYQTHTFGFRSYSSAKDPSRDLRIRTGGKDGCLDKKTLREYYCNKEGYISSMDFECKFGCEKGRCLGIQEEIESEEEPIEIPEESEETMIDYVCSGCELDKKCYPFGYRKEGKFCSDDLVFINQLDKEISCENNFECKSNVCVSGECISEGLIKKILNWLQRLFGGG